MGRGLPRGRLPGAVARREGVALPGPRRPPASLLGRQQDIRRVSRQVRTGRLVILLGPGGVGKTSLALAVARTCRGSHPGGTYFVDISGASSGADVADCVARTIAAEEHPARRLYARDTWPQLDGAPSLLLLDNCEQALPGAADIMDELSSRFHNVAIIATSRADPRVMTGVTHVVAPLAVPAGDSFADPAALASCPSVRLFVERARQKSPGIGLAPSELPAIARLCQRLDGLPLAIELAAAWVDVLTPQQILDRLDAGYGLLARGASSSPLRHQSLHATLRWSFDLLTGEARQLLGRLSVFPGSFDLAAAESVCSGSLVRRDRVVHLLAVLVETSMVCIDEADAVSRRFRLLDTVRAFACETLNPAASRALRARHCHYMQVLVAEARADGTDLRPWLRRMGADLANIGAALSFTRESEPERYVQLVLDLCDYFELCAPVEGKRHVLAALELHPGPDLLRARLLAAAGAMSWIESSSAAAATFVEEAVGILRGSEEREALTGALGLYAFVLGTTGRSADARAVAAEELALARAVGAPRLVAKALVNTALAALNSGAADASRLLDQAVEAARACPDDPLLLAEALQWSALDAVERGDLASACAFLVRSLEIKSAFAADARIAFGLETFAMVAHARRDRTRAGRLLGAASACRDRAGSAIPLDHKLRLERRLAGILRACIDGDLQDAWREGAALTCEEAVAYAVAGAAEPAPPAPGLPSLTPREQDIARRVCDGLTNRAIAEELTISLRTVDAHVEHIRRKLGVHSRVGIASAWLTGGPEAPRRQDR